MARSGSAGFGLVWQAWRGPVRLGTVRLGLAGMALFQCNGSMDLAVDLVHNGEVRESEDL